MEPFEHVVKVVCSSPRRSSIISQIFSSCGKITALYPYNPNMPEDCHFFLQFADSVGCDRALKQIAGPGTNFSVHSVSKDPNYVAQYCSVNPSAISASDHDGLGLQSNLQNIPDTAEKRKPKPKSGLNSQMDLPAFPSLLYHPAFPANNEHSINPASVFQLLETTPNAISNHSAFSSTTVPTPSTTVNLPNVSSSSSAPVVSSILSYPTSATAPAGSPIGPGYTMNTHIVLSICDEDVSFDLDLLDSDPRGIIELLKSTMCERGTWMIVSAHYRRRGLPSSAIDVLTEMLEVMATRCIPESTLRPVFLLLSSCERDLAKQGKNETRHNANSLEWLQKVYGVNAEPLAPNGPVLPLSLPLKPKNASPSKPLDMSKSPNIPGLPSRPPPPATTSKLPANERTLEREIQSLRDRGNHINTLLGQERASKRKLEDNITKERQTRRRLERQLDDAKKELDNAKKMEGFALEQMKWEVETRRRAEERADREKVLQVEVEQGRISLRGR